MNQLSRFLPLFALLGLAAVSPLDAVDLSSATATVTAAEASQSTQASALTAQPISQPEPLPDWMNPKPIQSQIQTGPCSVRTKCYGSPFPWVSCSGQYTCYVSNGCYVYCDGNEYDCPPFYLCP